MSATATPLLEVTGLTKHFPLARGAFRRRAGEVRAVDGIDFTLGRRETLALVGESGCGKTTAGRALLRLIEPTGGKALYRATEGSAPVDLLQLSQRALRPLRRDLQIVFQDPFSSLNPRLTVGNTIGEALRVHGVARGSAVDDHVVQLLGKVGLRPDVKNRFPHEFSGGQRQRIGIARALALSPKLVVCDEAVSALDVSIQAQVINLLKDLQVELGLAYLFIAHDLSVVRYISDRVAVMYLGRIVELGRTQDVFERPQHPYTRALLSAIPQPDPRARRQRVVLVGDVPSPIAPPRGCHFHTRCPVAVKGLCDVTYPAQRTVPAAAPTGSATPAQSTAHSIAHWAACHLVEPPIA